MLFYFVNTAEGAADYLNTKINRLPSIIRDRVKLTYMIMQKEQVNLCSIERSHADANYSYILLIIVSDHNKVSKSAEIMQDITAQVKLPPKVPVPTVATGF